MKLTIILEKNEVGFWARIENVPDFPYNTFAPTIEQVNLIEVLTPPNLRPGRSQRSPSQWRRWKNGWY